MKNSITLHKYIYLIIGIFFIFILWTIISLSQNNEFIFPNIFQIFNAFSKLILEKEILISSLFTLLRVLLVCIISFIISSIIALIYVLNKETIFLFKPMLILLKASPLAIISVYLWIALGAEIAPYLITLLMVLPVMIEGLIASINNIDQIYIDALKLEKVSIFKKFYYVYLPMILPYIIMSFLQTFGLGIKVMIMGEYICQSNNSLGQIIYILKQNLAFDQLLALLILILIIVFLVEFLIKTISKKLINR